MGYRPTIHCVACDDPLDVYDDARLCEACEEVYPASEETFYNSITDDKIGCSFNDLED